MEAMSLVKIARTLSTEVSRLAFSAPVAHVYHPLRYAWEAHKEYLERYGTPPKKIILLGMNPGPFGMTQTGVPFGDVTQARDFLGITDGVRAPRSQHPARPVQGFDCPRSEVSGTRLWSWAQDRFGTSEGFFETFFVANYCPLVFLEESGRNRTPDKLPAAEQKALYEVCDRALAATVELLRPDFAIGVGAFAEKRLRQALPQFAGTIGRILHPSPASPAANRGWAEQVDQQLQAMGITS
jgi:single-strand selective monofunctional uracil DNA glycosylase